MMAFTITISVRASKKMTGLGRILNQQVFSIVGKVML
jgi:hypothetical protein